MILPDALHGARTLRRLRDRGVTVRKTIDVIIGTHCVEHGCALVHGDRDFLPTQGHPGLPAVGADHQITSSSREVVSPYRRKAGCFRP